MISLYKVKEIKNETKTISSINNRDLNSVKNTIISINNLFRILLTTLKIIEQIFILILNLRHLIFSLSILSIPKRIIINPILFTAKTSLSLIFLPIRISKLLLKLIFILLLLKLFINFTQSKKHSKSKNDDFQTIISTNENFYSNLNQEYSHFLKQYEKNSCIMEVFNNLKLNCNSEKSDEINPVFAYKMTECFFNSLGKEFPECTTTSAEAADFNYSSFHEFKECIRRLKGDAWTTFTNFENHIDNLCFFHKTLIWEKSSEFIYSKMLNSTIGILAELSHGSNIANRILVEQEKFSSQLKDNMTNTLEEFKKIQTYFESFEKLEAKIKNDMIFIERKINKNNQHLLSTLQKLSGNFQFIDGFFFDKKGEFALKFYVFLVVYVFVFSFNANVSGFKFKLLMVILFFVCCEKLLFRNYRSTAADNDSSFSDEYKLKKNLIEFNHELEEELKQDFIKNYFHNEKQNNKTNNESIKEKFEIFDSLKFSFATLLNSTFSFNSYMAIDGITKDHLFPFNYFDSFLNSFFIYFYRLICFIILNVICCILKGNKIKREKDKNYFEKILLSDYVCDTSSGTKGFFSNLSNSKVSLTPLWMRKYFSRIQDKNEELLEKFKVLKTKLHRESKSLVATPCMKHS